MSKTLDLYLIRPTRYDEDGYPVQWWRTIIPSNSLACVNGIAQDAAARKVLGNDVAINITAIDEINSIIDTKKIVRRQRQTNNPTLVCFVGVQTNQFPRATAVGRRLLEAGIPVCIGGFHASGCIPMLKDMPPALKRAAADGMSFFAGEAEEGRMDEVLRDAYAGTLKPIYGDVKRTPNLAGAALPSMPLGEIKKNINRYASFDLGRGCPFECSFCTIINVQGRKSRFRTPDDLEAIVRENAANGINRFFLTDDNFARNKAWKSFTDRLIELREKGFPVRMAIQVDTIAHKIDGFIEGCVAAGADQIFIGLENINSDSLELVKKRQNHIEDYREMFMAWKKHPVFIICGYIIGFPNDTYDGILRDIEIIKTQLPVDAIYLNFLTPLPGSEDHKRLYESGVWMDPDMNKYDLNHRVTHHPTMQDEEWEAAYWAAHKSFYEFDHMQRIIKRMVALRSNKKLTTVNRLIAYREGPRLEKVSALESGYIRLRRRRERRPELPLEHPLVFYPKYGWRLFARTGTAAITYLRLRLMLRRALRDPDRLAYTDAAIMPTADQSADDVLVTSSRVTSYADKRRKRKTAAAMRNDPEGAPERSKAGALS